MAHLEELINSLATVIVRYHDSQKKWGVKPCVKEEDSTPSSIREYTIALLEKDDFDQRLFALNVECTTQINYPSRLPFLNFITEEIIALKNIMYRQTIFKTQELEAFKEKITRLLVDLKELLSTPKAKTHTAQVNHFDSSAITVLALSGMLDNGNFYDVLCSSGKLIKEEVLEKLKIKDAATEKDIAEVAKTLCQDHHIALSQKIINKQDLALRTKDEELATAQQAIATLNAELEKTKLELKGTQTQLELEKLKKTTSPLILAPGLRGLFAPASAPRPAAAQANQPTGGNERFMGF